MSGTGQKQLEEYLASVRVWYATKVGSDEADIAWEAMKAARIRLFDQRSATSNQTGGG